MTQKELDIKAFQAGYLFKVAKKKKKDDEEEEKDVLEEIANNPYGETIGEGAIVGRALGTKIGETSNAPLSKALVYALIGAGAGATANTGYEAYKLHQENKQPFATTPITERV